MAKQVKKNLRYFEFDGILIAGFRHASYNLFVYGIEHIDFSPEYVRDFERRYSIKLNGGSISGSSPKIPVKKGRPTL